MRSEKPNISNYKPNEITKSEKYEKKSARKRETEYEREERKRERERENECRAKSLILHPLGV